MDHLLHTSQTINTFSDVSEWSRLLLFAHPLALGPWGEPGVGEGSSEGEVVFHFVSKCSFFG